MLAVDDRILLSGSEPECRPGVRSVGAPDPNERLHIAIPLFPRGAMGERQLELRDAQANVVRGDGVLGGEAALCPMVEILECYYIN